MENELNCATFCTRCSRLTQKRLQLRRNDRLPVVGGKFPGLWKVPQRAETQRPPPTNPLQSKSYFFLRAVHVWSLSCSFAQVAPWELLVVPWG